MLRTLLLSLVLSIFAFGSESDSANPGAVNEITGTGALGEKVFGLNPDTGVQLGGLWIPDYNYLFSGGLDPHQGGGNNLLQLSLYLDLEKLNIWRGGRFYVDFLQFNGSAVNDEAGSVQGYNGLVAQSPFQRSELYQFWFQQMRK